MKVTLNNTTLELNDGATLAQALEKENISLTGIAVAVNETVIPKNGYAKHTLKQGDSIIIIKAFYGG